MITGDKRAFIDKFIRFFGVGFVNFAADFAVFTLIYRVAGLAASTAQAAGYIAGTINSLLLNRAFTYRKRGAPRPGEIVRFAAVNAVSFVISYGVMLLLSDIMGFNAYLVKVAVIGVTLCINFLGYTFWVFR